MPLAAENRVVRVVRSLRSFEAFERQAGRLPYWLFSALSAALWLIFNELPGVKGAYE
jgi:hypothetical protein